MSDAVGRQPLLHAACAQVAAPTQAWSGPGGDMGPAAIDGLYHSNTRVLDRCELLIDRRAPEPLGCQEPSSGVRRFTSVLRGLAGEAADPRLRVERVRRLGPGTMRESVQLVSGLGDAVHISVQVRLRAAVTSIQAVKAGRADDGGVEVVPTTGGVSWGRGAVAARLDAAGASIAVTGSTIALTWQVQLPPCGTAEVGWAVSVADAAAVVAAPAAGPAADRTAPPWNPQRVPSWSAASRSWIQTSLNDLASLRLVPKGQPDVFLAAGAPWYLTLFGRDSLWAARFLVPLDVGLAMSTLRALAHFQGRRRDEATQEQPGKIVHELRPSGVESGLPPQYYGTIDATPLWIVLLHEAWRAGADPGEVAALLPQLRAALAWMRDDGIGPDGFLRYRGNPEAGLVNQGWKDSGDAIRFRDGSWPQGSIALSEVQGYAYQAGIAGAELLAAFADDPAVAGADPQEWVLWAGGLRERFHRHFWVADAAGPYPAMAVDGTGRRVDAVASNMGHLLGTGILDQDQAGLVAERLVGAGLNSGFGLRTMSARDGAYWPLSYHLGSVWPHDTAIAIRGLVAQGFVDEARVLADGLERAATHFGYRLPELYSGDGLDAGPTPIPYPAACRPQAWAAAAAIAVAFALHA